MREFGINVDDRAHRHKGQQSISDLDFKIPLELSRGLLTFKSRQPTDEELDTLNVFTLTSDTPWNPSDLSDESPPPDSLWQPSVSHTSSSSHIPNFPYIRQYLGWVNEEVAKHTLGHTTQLAKNIAHLPLRKHIKTRCPHLNHPPLREL